MWGEIGLSVLGYTLIEIIDNIMLAFGRIRVNPHKTRNYFLLALRFLHEATNSYFRTWINTFLETDWRRRRR